MAADPNGPDPGCTASTEDHFGVRHVCQKSLDHEPPHEVYIPGVGVRIRWNHEALAELRRQAAERRKGAAGDV